MEQFLKFWLVVLVLALLTSCNKHKQRISECDRVEQYYNQYINDLDRFRTMKDDFEKQAYLKYLNDLVFKIENKPIPVCNKNIHNKKEYLLRRIDFIKQNL